MTGERCFFDRMDFSCHSCVSWLLFQLIDLLLGPNNGRAQGRVFQALCLAATMMGVITLLVLLAGWIPFIGGLLLAVLSLVGIGAVVLELHARLPGRKPPVGGPPLPAPAAGTPG